MYCRGFIGELFFARKKKNIFAESGCSGGHRGGSHQIFSLKNATDWATNMRQFDGLEKMLKKTQSQK